MLTLLEKHTAQPCMSFKMSIKDSDVVPLTEWENETYTTRAQLHAGGKKSQGFFQMEHDQCQCHILNRKRGYTLDIA